MSRKYYPILFTSFIIAYFFLYAFYGYNDADDGYILALSWRVFNGEIPYKDFIYIRPPFTPFFHSLPLYIIPENYQIIFERFLSFLFMALSSLFCSLSIERVFKNEIKINFYLLATIGFVYSAHNFSPMPWYTVDGVFFASLGIYLLIRSSTLPSIFLGILFLFFSALCKQPFYLMPFAGIVYVHLVYKNWKKTLFSVFTFGFFLSLFIFILYKLDALKNFIDLTTGSTKIADLLTAGVFSYFKVYSLYIIQPFAFWILSVKLSRYDRLKRIKELVPYFFISFILLYPLSQFVYSSLYSAIPYNPTVPDFYMDSLASFLFMATVFFLILNFKFENNWISLSFFVLLA